MVHLCVTLSFRHHRQAIYGYGESHPEESKILLFQLPGPFGGPTYAMTTAGDALTSTDEGGTTAFAGGKFSKGWLMTFF